MADQATTHVVLTDDTVYLHHILRCILRIEEDTRNGRVGFAFGGYVNLRV